MVSPIVVEEQRRNNEKCLSHHPSLLSPSFFCFLCSVIIINPDHYQANSPLTVMERKAGLPRGFGERFLTAAAKEEGIGWGENEDKRPNKVHLNLETARPFSPCPYKELLVNPGRLSSSLR